MLLIAILLISNEDPLPVDVETALIAQGIDVSELYRKYRP